MSFDARHRQPGETRKERESFTAMRKLAGAASPSASRASVRYAGGSPSRYSRGSVRNSVRPGQSGMSALHGAERVAYIDREGRDRTPKPLQGTSRAHANPHNPSMGGDTFIGWSSEGPDASSSSSAASDRLSFQGQQQLAGLASLATFELADAPKTGLSRDSGEGSCQPLHMPTKKDLPAAQDSTGEARASVPGINFHVHSKRAPQRNRGAQCEQPQTANHSCQALPWELASNGKESGGSGAAKADPITAGASGGTQAVDNGGQDGEGEQEAMQAMESALMEQDSYAAGAGRDSRLHQTDRVSRAGSSMGRPSGSYDVDRRSTSTSLGPDSFSERASRASVASYATFMGGQSFKMPHGSMGTSRAGSVMMTGYRQHAPSPVSAAEAAAEAARRVKAEQQRAVARLPNIESHLHSVEQLVAQNAYQAEIAQCMHVKLCTGTTAEAAAGDSNSAGVNSHGQLDRLASIQQSISLVVEEESTQVTALASSSKAASSGSEPQAVWQWKSESSEELPVSCMSWNKIDTKLLAVGFGQLQYSVAAKGMVAFYSLRNPGNPIWHFSTPCGVSALDFSGKAGSVLAVGMFDGSVALYDVRARSATPIARVAPAGPDGSGGHAEPVWALIYVSSGTNEGDEMLVSTSTDGRVLAWKHTQTLEPSELMRLKRAVAQRRVAGALPAAEQAKKEAGQGAAMHTEGLLGRLAGGTCFDFSPADSRTYLVGTEEGLVHKCSTVFTEQFIQTYPTHSAPVYQVRWSPFRPSCFLTASADWTLRLWSDGQPTSLWTFQVANAKNEINDVEWCPYNSTVFAAAAGNTLQLWDLEHSVLRPKASITWYGVRLTALCFCPEAPVLLCGADDGTITAYSMAAVYKQQASAAQEAERLDAVLQTSVYHN